MKNTRVVIIGLDGANKTTANLVGIPKSPNTLISTIPPYTPPAWTSIVTGVNPGKHGIIGWQRVDFTNNTRTLTTARDVRYPRISEILERTNLRSILINVPMTYPFDGIQKKANTTIVTDWAAPKQEIFPKKLEEKYHEYLVDPPHEWSELKEKEYPKRVREFTETRLSMYYDLLEKTDWNLYFIVFSETDWFSHKYPQLLKNEVPNKDIKITFKIIREFIETASSLADVTLIVSDHGFEIKNKTFYINEALAQAGFIQYSRIKAKIANGSTNKVLRNVFSKITKYIIHSRAKNRTTSNLPLNYLAQDINAIMIENGTWGIYVRNKSIIPQIKSSLERYKEIYTVLDSRTIYHGPYSYLMPDLIAIPNKGIEFSGRLGKGLVKETYKGGHNLYGILSIFGTGINENVEFKKSPKLYDLVPTVLHIFGLPIPRDTDGRVLIEIFEENSKFAKRKLKFTDKPLLENTLIKRLASSLNKNNYGEPTCTTEK